MSARESPERERQNMSNTQMMGSFGLLTISHLNIHRRARDNERVLPVRSQRNVENGRIMSQK